MILVLGPRMHKSGKIGGVVVAFELFLYELRQRGLAHKVIDINYRNYSNSLSAALQVWGQVLLALYSAKHVTLHGKVKEFIFIGPVMATVCRVVGKPFSMRKFNGRFDEEFDALGVLQKKMVAYSMRRASFCFFETRYLVERFRKFNKNTFQFENCRATHAQRRDLSIPYQKRFVFVGHIRRKKGIQEILDAATRLGSGYSISLFGSIEDSYYEAIDWLGYPNVCYGGRVAAAEVPSVLRRHDVLLLPSYMEGYPGVIIEALQVGLPVIATNLLGIREMITPGLEGLLVEPRDVESLAGAMESIDQVAFESMSGYALLRARTFDSENVTGAFLRTIGADF